MMAWPFGWIFSVWQSSGYHTGTTAACYRSTSFQQITGSSGSLCQVPLRCCSSSYLLGSSDSHDHFVGFVGFDFVNVYTEWSCFLGSLKYQVYWIQNLGKQERASEFLARLFLTPVNPT